MFTSGTKANRLNQPDLFKSCNLRVRTEKKNKNSISEIIIDKIFIAEFLDIIFKISP